MRRMLRRAVPVGIAVAAASVLSGCGVVPAVCPAIGWINTVVVSVSDARIVAVDICDERGCASAESSPSEIVGFQPPIREGTSWVFALPDMSTPDDVTVRATAADGSVLVENAVQLEWHRVGGSEQCGGPAEARLNL